MLTRAERIERLTEENRFDMEEDSPIGMVKVANRQVITKKEKKVKETDEETTAEGEAPAEGEEAKSE